VVIFAPSAITPIVKAISRRPGWSFDRPASPAPVSSLTPRCSTSWSTA
jgi:hypothetical protein